MREKHYFKNSIRNWNMVLGLLLLFSIILTLTLGSVKVPVSLTIKILLNQLPFVNLNPVWSTSQEDIILALRLPRIFVAVIVGAMLATAGTAFQGILRNPLADPYILGISSGAAVGAASAILLVSQGSIFWSGIALPLFSFLGAILSLGMVFVIAWNRKRETVSLILAGVVVQSFLGAILSFAITVSGHKLKSIVFWLMGSLAAAGWKDVLFLLPYLLICYLIIYAYYRNFNILVLGEQAAQHLGMNVEKTKIIALVAASLLTAAAVSVVGIIGFVGLIVPHIIRILAGPDHKILLPASCLAGAIFLLWSDTLARTLIPAMEIPIGVITALAGAPFFGYLLKKRV
jgi:iron complex transport system permease protein